MYTKYHHIVEARDTKLDNYYNLLLFSVGLLFIVATAILDILEKN